MLESSAAVVQEKRLSLEETERKAVRAALLEERGRFCLLARFLKPVLVSRYFKVIAYFVCRYTHTYTHTHTNVQKRCIRICKCIINRLGRGDSDVNGIDASARSLWSITKTCRIAPSFTTCIRASNNGHKRLRRYSVVIGYATVESVIVSRIKKEFYVFDQFSN